MVGIFSFKGVCCCYCTVVASVAAAAALPLLSITTFAARAECTRVYDDSAAVWSGEFSPVIGLVMRYFIPLSLLSLSSLSPFSPFSPLSLFPL